MPHGDAGAGGKAIDICVCTFRRPHVAVTLRSIALQDLPSGVSVRVIVADNDDEPSAREGVTAVAVECALDLVYVHAPARNISVARNACLDHARSEWFAFIDDDERASPGWLAALLAKCNACNAPSSVDAVFGPVRAVYDSAAPEWLRQGQFHATSVVVEGGEIRTGYSGNVLIRKAAVDRLGLRFDPALGTLCGEDTMFFGRFYDGGGRFAFAPDAIVDEPVAAARTGMVWLVRRSFLSGRAYGMMWLKRYGGRLRPLRALRGAATVGLCAFGVAAMWWQPVRWRRWLLRGALHAGAVSVWIGLGG